MKIRTIALLGAVAGGLLLNSSLAAAPRTVVVWSEGTAPTEVYPKDINGAIVEGLTGLPGWNVVRANLSDPDQGLSDELLKKCDVLVWWGHKRHGEVKNELVQKIVQRVKEDGMGFISLHSAHFAKPNIALMSVAETSKEVLAKVQPRGRVAAWGAYVGDSVTLKVTVKDPAHPIAKGVGEFTIAHGERYSDPYAVPAAKSIVFEGDATLKNGKIDHSQVGFTWDIGKGKMFYFQAGHETDPVFFDKNVRLIMANAVQWAAPSR
jgi:trehalose utilization protein